MGSRKGGAIALLFAVVAALLCTAEGMPQSSNQRSEITPIGPYNVVERRQQSQQQHQRVHHSSSAVRPFSQAVDPRDEARVGSESLPVRPFSQSNQRDVVPESTPVRPFSQSDGQRSESSQRVVANSESHPIRPFSETGPLEREQHASSGSRDSQRDGKDPFQSRAHSAPLNPRITLQPERGQDAQQNQRHHHHHQAQSSSTSSQGHSKKNEETPNWSTGLVRFDSGDGRAQSGTQQPHQRRSPAQEQKGSKLKGVQQGQVDRGSTFRMGTVDVVEVATAGRGKERVDASVAEGSNPMNFDKEGIIFPGPTKVGSVVGSRTRPETFVPPVANEEPHCAKGNTFCESIDNYPSEYLKTVLKYEGEVIKDFFGKDLLLNDTSIAERIDYVNESPMCQAVEQIVYPKIAQNKENKWLYVVNQDQYVQGVLVEKCLKPESECQLANSFPIGYKTTCRQKYIYRRMLALNDDGKAHTDTFRLPSCCSCYVKQVGVEERRR